MSTRHPELCERHRHPTRTAARDKIAEIAARPYACSREPSRCRGVIESAGQRRQVKLRINLLTTILQTCHRSAPMGDLTVSRP